MATLPIPPLPTAAPPFHPTIPCERLLVAQHVGSGKTNMLVRQPPFRYSLLLSIASCVPLKAGFVPPARSAEFALRGSQGASKNRLIDGDRETDRRTETNKQTETDSQTDRQPTDRQPTDRQNSQTHRQAGRQAGTAVPQRCAGTGLSHSPAVCSSLGFVFARKAARHAKTQGSQPGMDSVFSVLCCSTLHMLHVV